MTKLQTLHRDDSVDIAAVWQRNFTPQFAADEKKIRKNLFSDSDFCEAASFTARGTDGSLTGFIGVKTAGETGVYDNTAWVSAFAVDKPFRNKGVGTLLYTAAEKELLSRGIKRIYIGQDFNNFFSGIPDPDDIVCGFFGKLGFRLNPDLHFDLEADIVHNELIDRFDTAPFAVDFSVSVLTAGDKELLLSFLAREFPGRWRYEAEQYFTDVWNDDAVTVLRDRPTGVIEGYCKLSNNAGYGGLGPIGIAECIRGKKVGAFLLHESLLQLRQMNAVRVCIDWTMLRKFYGQFGFVPIRIFRGAYKDL